MNMKVSMMNVKSKILKLSIILMLILVLIPVVAAEDSSESFFIEYAEESSEDVIVEESYSIEEVEYAQEDTVISSEYGEVEAEYEDLSTYDNHLEESIEDNCDATNMGHVECSAEVSQNIQVNEDSNYISSENFAEMGKDIFENNDCEITTDDISVISQGSFFISENDYNSYVFLINTVLNTETTNYETSSFNRGLTKILELKNKNEILILCSSCFLKFNPCFYAFISCDFLTVDGFFGGDFIIASKLFCDFAVELRENDLYPENFNSNLNLIRG